MLLSITNGALNHSNSHTLTINQPADFQLFRGAARVGRLILPNRRSGGLDSPGFGSSLLGIRRAKCLPGKSPATTHCRMKYRRITDIGDGLRRAVRLLNQRQARRRAPQPRCVRGPSERCQATGRPAPLAPTSQVAAARRWIFSLRRGPDSPASLSAVGVKRMKRLVGPNAVRPYKSCPPCAFCLPPATYRLPPTARCLTAAPAPGKQ